MRTTLSTTQKQNLMETDHFQNDMDCLTAQIKHSTTAYAPQTRLYQQKYTFYAVISMYSKYNSNIK